MMSMHGATQQGPTSCQSCPSKAGLGRFRQVGCTGRFVTTQTTEGGYRSGMLPRLTPSSPSTRVSSPSLLSLLPHSPDSCKAQWIKQIALEGRRINGSTAQWERSEMVALQVPVPISGTMFMPEEQMWRILKGM